MGTIICANNIGSINSTITDIFSGNIGATTFGTNSATTLGTTSASTLVAPSAMGTSATALVCSATGTRH